MNKLIFVFLVFLIVLTQQGCTVSTSYLQPTSPSEDIITRNGIYTAKFFVKNPTQNTFVGTIEYQYDTKCLSTITMAPDEITITPQEAKKAMTKEFRTSSVNKECSDKPQRISVIIRDKGGEIKDSFDIILSISS